MRALTRTSQSIFRMQGNVQDVTRDEKEDLPKVRTAGALPRG